MDARSGASHPLALLCSLSLSHSLFTSYSHRTPTHTTDTMSLTPDSTSEKHRVEHKELASRQGTHLDSETQDVDPAFARSTVCVDSPSLSVRALECAAKCPG